MAFGWNKTQGNGIGRGRALAVAVGLTALMFAAIATGVGRRVVLMSQQVTQRAAIAYERIAYASTSRPAPASVAQSFPRTPVSVAATDRSIPAGDSAGSAGGASRNVSSVSAALDPDPVDPRLRVALPRRRVELVLPRYDITRALTMEQRDSVLGALAMSLPVLVADLKPTKETLDSVARDLDSKGARARDEKRPMAVPLGAGGGFALGIGRGPTREQRRRDSIIHDDNLQRLQRLALRLKSKQDSARRADSIASVRTQKVDSTDD
jgi:hypothetical protein